MTEVRHYDDLIAALRSRADACGLSNIVLEDLTGLPSGYVGKLFGPARIRHVGLNSIWQLLEALALRMVLEPDLSAAARMEVRWERRDERYRRVGVNRRHSPELRARALQEEMSRLGSIGGPARAACLTGKQRSKIAKKAANARWKKARSARALSLVVV